MNPEVQVLYTKYLAQLSGDKAAAASLTLADVLLSGRTAQAAMPQANRALTVREAAQRLHLSDKKVYGLVHSGRLGSFRADRAVRIPTHEIERFEATCLVPRLLPNASNNKHGVIL